MLEYIAGLSKVEMEHIPIETDTYFVENEPLSIKTEVVSSESDTDNETDQPDNEDGPADETLYGRSPLASITDEDIRLLCDMKCPFCSEQFEKYDLLKTHCRQVHNEKGYAICCSSKLHTFKRLKEHILVHIDPTAFRCNICDKNLTSTKNLIRHHNALHPAGGDKTYDCEVCSKKFTALYMLNDHVKFEHLRDQKFGCPHCSKRFISSKRLSDHVRVIHEKVTGMTCDICSKVFMGKCNLDRHRSTHSTVRVNCPICQQSLKNEWTLQKHLQRHREATMDLKCEFCDKRSPSLHALRQHIQTAHIQERNHRCTTCGKTFKRSTTLKAHMLIHTNELPIACDLCEKRCRTASLLHGHRKKYHPEVFEKRQQQKSMATNE
ncbi:hypothetical protein RP20_CCG012891 [Aedes albopictus]|nr:hypothetical protein RP20_CCG012891 [Aedes albopictus]